MRKVKMKAPPAKSNLLNFAVAINDGWKTIGRTSIAPYKPPKRQSKMIAKMRKDIFTIKSDAMNLREDQMRIAFDARKVYKIIIKKNGKETVSTEADNGGNTTRFRPAT